MTTPATSSKPFKVGTTGWTVADLLDPRVAAEWDQGRYEIVEGVLTVMPAANLYANRRLVRLADLVKAYLGPGGARGEFAYEIDVALTEDRVIRVDGIFMTPDDDRRQREALALREIAEEDSAPVFVPPTLVIESVSRGHERHDRVTKRRWYAEAGIPNYWLLTVPQQLLECLVLDGADYRVDQSAEGNAEVRPSLFPGLVILLADLWRD